MNAENYVASIFLDFGLFFSLEVETDSIQPLLPEGVDLEPSENGKAGLMFNLVHFMEGGDVAQMEACWEIDAGARVELDNKMFPIGPEALSASFLLNVASTSIGYNEECERRSYPMHPRLDLKVVEDEAGFNISDGEGMIARVEYAARDTVFAPYRQAGQDVMVDPLGIVRVNYEIAAEGTQLSLEEVRLILSLEHPFFTRLSLIGAEPKIRKVIFIKPEQRHSVAFFKGHYE